MTAIKESTDEEEQKREATDVIVEIKRKRAETVNEMNTVEWFLKEHQKERKKTMTHGGIIQAHEKGGFVGAPSMPSV